MFSLVRFGSSVLGAILGAALIALAAFVATPAAAQEGISFEGDVMPILQVRCMGCHRPGGDGYEVSGLDLTSYQGLMKGTKFGPIVEPGNAIMSNFLVIVDGRASAEIRMPHDRKKLTRCEISILRRWVNAGAKNN